MSIRILIASDLAYPYIGGGENYVIQLSKALLAEGCKVHWLTSRILNTKKHENYQGIDIHRVPILLPNRYVFPGRQSFALSAVTSLGLARKMDVLQFNTFVAGVSGWMVGKMARKPTVLMCHEMFNDLWKRVGRNFIERTVYPLVEKVIARSPYDWFVCPSEYSKQTLIKSGVEKSKISVLPHGVDTDLFNPGKRKLVKRELGLEGSKLFGFTGRLSLGDVGHSKNLRGLLEATKIVSQRMPKAKLILGGKKFENIDSLLRKLGIEKNVKFLGRRPFNEVPNFLKTCDVIVCPALADGYCFLIAESSACGVPVVATKAGSHTERVKDQKTGLLTGTSPEELAEGIIEALSNNKLAKKLGKHGADHYKKLSWKNVAKKYISLYSELVNK